jgi:hypothetical protein
MLEEKFLVPGVKWILDWVGPRETVREMHAAQLLHAFYSLNVGHTNFSAVR